MSDSTLFTKLDADRILQRAAEIEGSDPDRAMSVSEIRGIAGEAGFGATAVERAIAEALEVGPPGSVRASVEREGILLVKMWTIRTIPVELDSDQLIRAVRLFQPYREGPANVNLEDRQITWRDRKGLMFHLMSYGGETEIRVRVSKLLVLRGGRMMGWVRAAADRLESLIYLVAARDLAAPVRIATQAKPERR